MSGMGNRRLSNSKKGSKRKSNEDVAREEVAPEARNQNIEDKDLENTFEQIDHVSFDYVNNHGDIVDDFNAAEKTKERVLPDDLHVYESALGDFEFHDYENEYFQDGGEDTINISERTALKPQCPDFDINPMIQNEIERVKQFQLPADDILPLFENGPLSKGQFSRELLYILHAHKCPMGLEKDLLMLFIKSIPESIKHQLPVKKHVRNVWVNKEIVKTNTYYKSLVNDYIPPPQRTFRFDICKKGCCAFAGQFKDMLACPTCKEKRLKQCSLKGCDGKTSDEECIHGLYKRIPDAFVQYKPLLPLFIQLIKSKSFLTSLQYINEDTADDKYNDVMDGRVMKANMHEMNVEMKEFQKTKPNLKIIQVPLLCSIFYDGVKVHSTRQTNFWPLMFSIINLPPTFRGTVGAGNFMIALFTAVKDSCAEDFLFSDCLIPELQTFSQGVLIEIDQTFYFIQVRLIMHILDTPGIESHLKVQATNAKAGCPLCKLILGTTRPSMDRTTFEGHRVLTEETNYTRSFGQSCTCCPTDYHTDGGKTFQPIIEMDDIIDHEITPKHASTHLNHRALESMHICTDNVEKKAAIIKAIKDNQYTWHHTEIDYKRLKDILYYHHMDFRSKKDYSRVHDREYLRRAREIELNRRLDHFEGVKGTWLFHNLSGASINQHTMWEQFHSLYNVGSNIIHSIKGDRVDLKVRKFCRSILCHPCLYQTKPKAQKKNDAVTETKETKDVNTFDCVDDEPKPNFSIPEREMHKLDARINALLVPTGYKEHFQVQWVFQRTGMLRGIGHIYFINALLNFTMSSTNMIDDGYKAFYSMVSADVTLLMQHEVKDNEIEDIYKRVAELLATHDGVQPTSECLITWHQLLDAAYHIRKAGPIRNWWALAGERAMGVIKRFLTRGGTAFGKVVFNRYVNYETIIMLLSYSFSLEKLEEDQNKMHKQKNELLNANIYRSVKLKDGSLALSFSDQRIILKKQIYLISQNKLEYKLSMDETEELFVVLVNYVEKRSINLSAALQNSSFYRIRYFYIQHFQNGSSANTMEFIPWMKVWLHKINTDQLYPCRLINNSPLNTDKFEIKKALDDLCFFVEDYATLESLCSQTMATAFFKEAIIFGNKFNGRGFGHNERDTSDGENGLHSQINYGSQNIHDKRYWPNNARNILRDNWYYTKHYSSWCKFRNNKHKYRYSSFGTDPYDDKSYMFGQLNFFMHLSFPCDPFIDGIALASVTSRTHIVQNCVDYILGDDDGDSFIHNNIFVPLIDIFSTPIIVGAYHSPSVYNSYSKDLRRPQPNIQPVLQPEVRSQRGRVIAAAPYYKESLVMSKANIWLPDVQIETLDGARLRRLNEMLIDSQVFDITNTERAENTGRCFYANESRGSKELNGKLSYLVLLDMLPHRNSIKYSFEKDANYKCCFQPSELKPIDTYILLSG